MEVTPKLIGMSCQWKGCDLPAEPPSTWFCHAHAVLAEVDLHPVGENSTQSDKRKWAKDWAFALTTGVVSSGAYEFLRFLVEHSHVIGLTSPLEERIGVILEEREADTVKSLQDYVTLSQEPDFTEAVRGLSDFSITKGWDR